MAKFDLFFSGRRYPGARAMRDGDFVRLEPGDIVRPLELTRPEGVWRTFAALDLSSLDQVSYFAGRYGEPLFSAADPLPARFSSKEWAAMQKALANAADAYARSDKDGVSAIPLYPEEEDIRRAAIRALDDFAPYTMHTALGRSALDFRVTSLADHLRLSARYFLGATIPMRQCLSCGFWISAEHAAARFCDAVCRNNSAVGRMPKVTFFEQATRR